MSLALPLLLAASLLSANMQAPSAYKSPPPEADGIRSVTCMEPASRQIWVGTMVHIGKLTYVSAMHVGDASVCMDSKTQAVLVPSFFESRNDFMIFTTATELDDHVYKFSCKPVITGQTYTAVGYPNPARYAEVSLKAMKVYSPKNYYVEGMPAGHLRSFHGTIIPGMSGGALVDKDWTVYGINNIADSDDKITGERELADTALCK